MPRSVAYETYAGEYGGASIAEADWPRLMRRAAQRLERLKALSKVTPLGDADACEDMAICAMAEVYQAHESVMDGAAGVASESIGSVHVTYGDASKAMPHGVEQALLDSVRPWLHVCLVVV